MAHESDTDVLKLTATIVSAHIRNNQIAANAPPELIQSVHRSLATVGTAEPAPAPTPLTPAVPIRRSLFPITLSAWRTERNGRCSSGTCEPAAE